jgi:APA family basic amino acid/polyamine antiporter
MIVVANVIGSAIFLTSGLMLNELSTGGELLFVWTVGGILSLCGGFAYAELGAMHPRSGGLYVYLGEAYGPRVAFLFGWASLSVILTGQVAGLAVAFAESLSYFVPTLSPAHVLWSHAWLGGGTVSLSAGQIGAVATIAALGWLNMRSLHGSRNTVVYLALAVVAALVFLIGFALVKAPHLAEVQLAVNVRPSHVSALALAMIPVLYAYEGWAYLAFAASEVHEAGKNIPRALVLGICVVTALYVLTNVAYLSSLPAESLRGVQRVAEVAATASAGKAGAVVVSVAAMVSTLCNCVVTVFVAARVLFAMARQGVLPRSFGSVHPTRGTPDRAVLAVCMWSAALALTGSYGQLIDFVVFAIVLFAAAGGAAVFVLRRTQANQPRPYRTFGYPWVPLVFVVAMAGLAFNTLVGRPVQAMLGLGLVALGLPLYSLAQRRYRQRADRPQYLTAKGG